jgi:hypothetical protein
MAEGIKWATFPSDPALLIHAKIRIWEVNTMVGKLLRVLSTIGVCMLGLSVLAQSAFASCDPGSSYSSAPDNSHFAGYNLSDTPASSFAGVQATISTYNPFTVLSDSVWVMAVNDSCSVSGQCYAQTGYLDGAYGITTPVIWVEVSNTNGWWDVLKNATYASGWCNRTTDSSCTGETAGSGSHQYMIHQVSGNNQRFFAEYDNTIWFQNTTDLGWSSVTRYSVSGEVHAPRDQSPGGVNTNVTFTSIQVDNAGWQTAHLGSSASPSYTTWQNVSVTTSPSFKIWDSRCSN